MTRKLKTALAGILALAMLTGCNTSNNPDNPNGSQAVLEDRIAIDFKPSDYAVASTDARATVLNYLYLLSRGEYDAALEYCIIPDGVVFDEVALQKCVLAEGIGRGESITFFNTDLFGGAVDVEYDLSLSGASSTFTKTIKIGESGKGTYGINLEASDYIAKGSLVFGVPRYVKAYINDVEIDTKYLDSNFYYNITKGIAKLPSDNTASDTDNLDDNTSSNTQPAANITLRLDSKFGISQEYPLVFQGQATKSRKSVNDDYYRASNDVSVFTLAVPREVRNSALDFVQTKVVPSLMRDILNGVKWENASIKQYFGEGTEADAMFPDYYKAASTFADATLATDGRYYFTDFHSYNFEASDKLATNNGYMICVSDYNVLDLYFTCDYDYLYTKGSDAIERNATGSLRGLVQLSVDDSGEWYIHDLDSSLFKIALG